MPPPSESTSSLPSRLIPAALLTCILFTGMVAGPAAAQSGSRGPANWSVERVSSTRGAPIPFGAVPPGGVRFDETGAVYLLDIQAAQIYVLGPDLVLRGTLGRRGRGPGEFIQPTLMGAESGTVAVFDPGTSRITVFEDGAHAWDLSWSIAARGIPRRLEVVGGQVVMEVEPFPFRAPGVPTEGEPPKIIRVRRNGSHEVLATFTDQLAGGPRASAEQRPVIFAPSLHWTTGPGESLYTSVSDRYQVEVHDLASKTREMFAARAVSAAPTSDEVRSAVREQTLRRFAENRGQPALSGLNEDFVRQSIADMEFAERLPLTAEIIRGVRDLLLVQRGIGLIDDRSRPDAGVPLVSASWDLFGSDGSYAGMVEFPAGFVPVDGFGDLVVGIREGELGEVVLEVFRLFRS